MSVDPGASADSTGSPTPPQVFAVRGDVVTPDEVVVDAAVVVADDRIVWVGPLQDAVAAGLGDVVAAAPEPPPGTLVLLAITVSLGMARQGIVRWLRKALPHINRVSGLLMVLAGAYLAHYGWYEQRVRDGHLGRSSVVDRVTGWSDSVQRWVNDMGPTRLGLLLALGLLFVLVATFGLRARDRG